MNLVKRECGIKITLNPVGGFVGVHFDFYGKKFCFNPSETVSDQFGILLSAIYALFEEQHDFHDEWKSREFHSTKDHTIYGVSTRILWDNEGQEMEIIFSHNYASSNIDIEITRSDSKEKIEMTVDGKELCYGVAKACTDALKTYGFYGYAFSSVLDIFKLHQLLFVKAYALDAMDCRVLKDMNEWHDAGKTDFNKEIELLLFEM